MLTKKIKIIKCCALCFLIMGSMLFMTGCSGLSETFGKEYRMIDDFYDQLEADVNFSVNEYFSNKELTAEQKEALDNELKQISLEMQNAKKQTKSRMAVIDEYLEEQGYSGSVSEYLKEELLSEARKQIEQELETATEGHITLKHAKVKRGFFGSIWHFIRNHWIISLIILGLIGAVYETVQEIFG